MKPPLYIKDSERKAASEYQRFDIGEQVHINADGDEGVISEVRTFYRYRVGSRWYAQETLRHALTWSECKGDHRQTVNGGWMREVDVSTSIPSYGNFYGWDVRLMGKTGRMAWVDCPGPHRLGAKSTADWPVWEKES